MELNGFMIGPEIKTLFKIKVGAVFAEHPVELDCCREEATNGVFEPGCFPILIPDSDPTFSNLVKKHV